eukprot:CAMPEP_0181194042 /NCGR_PEP_ID=MMETSP1096-20121128/14131_1 /TAXON_ID=156174 ORGANISM="Chrysochromulina ericina, Strain CCMP281" /NCGR_SAMPLE_ID=MMETSP1096 /ASSEMBLY_ACC=CAM_ASM_000453 /LENGTH=1098 /DNA_ID=CAMNT_0023283529 /DNA_START=32 /DNA_END=3328 /DNA_ORIENTATION=+
MFPFPPHAQNRTGTPFPHPCLHSNAPLSTAHPNFTFHLHLASNFMSYTDAEITHPGSKLNCIVGPNGTGKSSIVCALCVGLGGPLKATERGDNVASCVHGEGSTRDPSTGEFITSGFVETELVDGSGPGQNLVVRLDFNIQNKKQWRLNGQQTTEKAVKAKMEDLNIQVDNPLQFLPQDKVGQFSNMSPIDLLKHTEMAIGPEVYQQHLQLIDADKELVEVQKKLVTQDQELQVQVRQNAVLQKDVDRYNQYLTNLQKLKQMQGKILWIRAEGKREETRILGDQWREAKDKSKELKAALKLAEQQEAPLAQAKKDMSDQGTKAAKEQQKLEEQRMQFGQKHTEVEEVVEELKDKLGKVDSQLSALVRKRDNAQSELERCHRDLRVEQDTLKEDFGSEFGQVERAINQALQVGKERMLDIETEESDFKNQEQELHRKMLRFEQQLVELDNKENQKQGIVAKQNKPSAELANWIEQQDDNLKSQVIGPLLMNIDVPLEQLRKMVENAIPEKYLFGFIVQTENTRDVLISQINKRNAQINVYKPPGQPFQPVSRPSSEELKKWGIHSWLDEAIKIPLDKRHDILSVLKDMCSIDRILIASDDALAHIDVIQAHLRSNGVSDFRLYTPSKTYNASVSNYGQKNSNSVTSMAKSGKGLFSTGVDAEQRKRLGVEKVEAEKALRTHQARNVQIQKRLQEAQELRADAIKKRDAFKFRKTRVQNKEREISSKTKKLDDAQSQLDDFDTEAQKAQCKEDLRKEVGDLVALMGNIAGIYAESSKLRAIDTAARAAEKVAHEQLQESRQKREELVKESQHTEQCKEQLKRRAKEAADECEKMQQAARAEAEEFDPENRSVEGERLWNALPSDETELEADIDTLKEDTAFNDSDKSGSTLRDFQERQRRIEDINAVIARTREEATAKEADVRRLEASWKPGLKRMIEQVNDNFSTYFNRFKCQGEITLSDGRKFDLNGQPEGPDNFAEYKIHIKVQWRATEQLHVLGEGGRDSGGERSVATMVYLISLQNINPAPFRVVDEINQAMDSTNERNVFECITHACNEGGKQYFLLTPKLLPDLNYGEDTVIQIVYNGPYMEKKDVFSLATFC